MKYLLTVEEYENLVPKQELKKHKEALEWARNEILRRANFECVYGEQRGWSYCDQCPVSSTGEDDNRPPSYHMTMVICDKNKKYSK